MSKACQNSCSVLSWSCSNTAHLLFIYCAPPTTTQEIQYFNCKWTRAYFLLNKWSCPSPVQILFKYWCSCSSAEQEETGVRQDLNNTMYMNLSGQDMNRSKTVSSSTLCIMIYDGMWTGKNMISGNDTELHISVSRIVNMHP